MVAVVATIGKERTTPILTALVATLIDEPMVSEVDG